MKYIFVTGGVVSSLGKGLTAAALGTVLENRGLKVALVDEQSGDVVRLRDIRPQAGPGADDLVRWRLAKFNESV